MRQVCDRVNPSPPPARPQPLSHTRHPSTTPSTGVAYCAKIFIYRNEGYNRKGVWQEEFAPKFMKNSSDAGDPTRLGSRRAPATRTSKQNVSCQLASASARICSHRVRPQPLPLGPAPPPYTTRHMRPTHEQSANTALAVMRFRCVETRDDPSTVDSHLRCTCSPEAFEVAAPSPTTLPFMSQYVDCSPHS